MDNFNKFNEELKACEKFKINFDKNLLCEIKKFVDTYNNTFSKLVQEFKQILKSISSEEIKVELYEM